MSKLLLITRPSYDITTRYLYAWNGPLIKLANDKNIDVVDLKKKKANRKDFEGRVKKLDPVFIVINGHGNEIAVCGHEDEVLVEVGKNEDLFNSKIIYSLSCKSAAILGIKSVEAGALCYIGYTKEFIFCHQNKSTRPLDDQIAGLFLGPSNQIVISLLKGNEVIEATRKSRNLSLRNVQKLLSSASSKESVQYARYLWWNLKHQVFLGSQNATF